MNLFFDTSALIKLFHDESGSLEVEHLINDNHNSIYITELSSVEFTSAIHRKFRESIITDQELSISIKAFEDQQKLFSIVNIDPSIINEAIALINSFGKDHSIRTLDAIQLGAFIVTFKNDWQFVLADVKLDLIIKSIGLNSIFIN